MPDRKESHANRIDGILIGLIVLAGIVFLVFEVVLFYRPSNAALSDPDFTGGRTPTSTNIAFVPTATASVTNTRLPTRTPTFTLEYPTMIPMMTPAVEKRAIAYLDATSGDGGYAVDYYFGADLPSLIIYEDGQIVVWKEEGLLETILSTQQLASFFGTLEGYGFFEDLPSIYTFPTDDARGEGAPSIILHADNGQNSQTIYVYYPYLDNVLPSVRRAYDYFRQYRPANLKKYMPLQMVLWIEEGEGEEYTYWTNDGPIEDWPSDLPGIPELGMGHVVVDERYIPEIMSLYPSLPGGKVFRYLERNYLVVARPLLPNEFPSFTWAS